MPVHPIIDRAVSLKQEWLQVGAESFRLCRELLDGVLLVDNQAISGAIEAVFNDTRSILEPAGAAAVAGATQYLEHNKLQVHRLCAIRNPYLVTALLHSPSFTSITNQ